MKSIIIFIAIMFTGMPAISAANKKLDLPHAISLNGVIKNGKIISNSNSDTILKNEIKQQLMYMITQLKGLDANSPRMDQLKISISKKRPLGYDLFEVVYRAQLVMPWPIHIKLPKTYKLVLPSYGNQQGLKSFFEAFGPDEYEDRTCLARNARNVTQDNFWYYYRPYKHDCPLARRVNSNLVRYQSIKLTAPTQETEDFFNLFQ